MVEYEQRDRIGLIRLNRPDARNAVNADVANGMEAAIDRLEDDPDTWVGVLTGEGPVFSAGADLKAIAAGQGNELGTARGGLRRHHPQGPHQADHRRRRRSGPGRRL